MVQWPLPPDGSTNPLFDVGWGLLARGQHPAKLNPSLQAQGQEGEGLKENAGRRWLAIPLTSHCGW